MTKELTNEDRLRRAVWRAVHNAENGMYPEGKELAYLYRIGDTLFDRRSDVRRIITSELASLRHGAN